jgi:hypothetical protein
MRLLDYTPPALLLSLLVASVYAALYNLWRNGSPRELGFCLVVAWAGFAVGQATGSVLQFSWGMVGSLHMAEGTVMAWGTLLLVNWLRLPGSSSLAQKQK